MCRRRGGESSFFSLAKYEGYGAVGDREAGDIAGIGWVRYDDPETKTFKLNVRASHFVLPAALDLLSLSSHVA